MPTRSGRNFSEGETFASKNPGLQDTLKTLIARMDQMDQWLLELRDQANTSYKDLATRLERLETNRRRTSLEMAVGHPGVSELNPTIQLTLMPNISKA